MSVHSAAIHLGADAWDRERRAAGSTFNYVHVIGRVLLATVFIVSGVAKWASFEATRLAMANAEVASPAVLLTVAIAIELVCGAFLIAGFRVRETAATLCVYLAVLTVAIHGDITIDANRAFAVANLGLIGGLVGLISHGAGLASVDGVRARREAETYRA